MQSQQRTLTCERSVCECDSICSCDTAARSRISRTQDSNAEHTVELPYFIYDFYDFSFIFQVRVEVFHELSHVSVGFLGEIRLDIPDALGEVIPGQSALRAVHVKLAGTLLHCVDAHADGELLGEGVAGLLDKIDVRQVEREPSSVQRSEHLALVVRIHHEGYRLQLRLRHDALQVDADVGQVQSVGRIDFNVAGADVVALLDALLEIGYY